MVHILQTMQNLVISRCWFAEDGKEMYHDSKRTCTAIVLLIKPFVWWHSRCRRRHGFVNSLIWWKSPSEVPHIPGLGGGGVGVHFDWCIICKYITTLQINVNETTLNLGRTEFKLGRKDFELGRNVLWAKRPVSAIERSLNFSRLRRSLKVTQRDKSNN